ncbi:MAG: hypothetical protein K0V04_24485 [Deltaproteobacteria bacterium]|nr:hypothetical protein [Deltaproteobacteria bacterium]
MRGIKGWMMAALAASMVTGCSGEEVDDLDPTMSEGAGKADEPGGSGTALMTRANNVELLAGYHGLFDRVGATCVDATNASRVVGALSDRYDLVYVSSREELARELGLDLKLKARYAGFEGDAGVDALRNFSSSARTVNLMLKIEQGYTVAENGDLQLGATGQQALSGGVQSFASTCGSNYVSAVEYSSSFMLMVSLECESANVANKIKASLKLETPAAVPVDGSVKGNLETVTKGENVRIQVQSIARGFQPQLSVSSLGKEGLDAQVFGVIDQLRTDMQKSQQRDMDYDVCLGSGQGCSGQRGSVPTGVKVGFYGDLPNVGDEAVFREIRDHWSEIEAISASMSRAHERLEGAHGELRDFLGASEQGPYNVYEPATPLATTKALRDLATARKAELDPTDGSSVTGRLFDTLQACWGRASDDVTYLCNDLEWEDQIAAADTVLSRYGQEARILPLDMLFVDASTAWWEVWNTTDPVAACRELSPAGSYRLPRAHELALVGPMVADGPIDWGSAQSNGIWYDSASACGGGQRPYYLNDGYSEPTMGCESNTSFITTVLCVPADGPQTPVQPI